MRKLLCLLAVLLCVAFPAGAAFEFPTDLTYIGEEAFAGNPGIQGEVIIPEGVTTIGRAAFQGCTGMTELVIPESVTTIEAYAFSGCVNLRTSIKAEGRVIADTAFEDCPKAVVIPPRPEDSPVEKFKYTIADGQVTISRYTGYESTVVIPAAIEEMPVTAIGKEAFTNQNCRNVEIIYLPDTVTAIGEHAFLECLNLQAVYGSENVVDYGTGAFALCEKLAYIDVSGEVKKLSRSCFQDCSALDMKLYLTENCALDLPTSIISGSSVSLFVFAENGEEATLVRAYLNEDTLRVPDTYKGLPVTRLGENCIGSIRHLTVPGSVKVLSNNFAYGDASHGSILETVTFEQPSSLVTIEQFAFSSQTYLRDIELPDSVTSIGDGAFVGCESLKSITLPEGLQHLGENAFMRSGITAINIPKGITSIPAYCFDESDLEVFTIPEHVTALGTASLSGTKLKSIVIPEWVTEFGDYLFTGCSELTDVTLPGNMTSLPMCMFANCTSLTTIDLPESIESFGVAVFEGCTNLEYVELPPRLTTVLTCAFRDSGLRAKAIEHVVAQCIKPGMSDFEKALALHDWLIHNADYSTKRTFFGAEGVLVYGEGVCQSYTDAFGMLLSAVGIPYGIVVSNDMDHAWNLVLLDGEWYHVDCTWDDPTGGGQENHQYFGLNDELMKQDHTWELPDFYPVATGTRYRYGVDHAPAATPKPTPQPTATPAPTPVPTPVPAPDLPESPVEDFEYSVADGEVTITEYWGKDTVVVVPATMQGLPVTAVGYNAFNGQSSIETVWLPPTVHSIEMQAFFGCRKLEAVYGAQNVIRYGEYAFQNCPKLAVIHFSDSIVEMGYGAFEGCALPPTVLCFPSDSPLTEARHYGEMISMYFFDVENGEAILTHAHCGVLNWKVNVPGIYRGMPVTAIAPNTLRDNWYIEGLTLPDSVKVIGENAFNNCAELKATIYAKGRILWYGAFADCPGVTITQQYPPTTTETPVQHESFECSAMGGEVTITKYTGSDVNVVVPDTIAGMPVTVIGRNAFNSRHTLETVTLPQTVHTIGEQAFTGCKNLTAVYGTENVVCYETSAFYGCSKLSTIEISENTAKMEPGCFSQCSALERVLLLPADSPLTSAYSYGENITMFFFDVKDGEAILTEGTRGSSDQWDVCVPESYRGMPVTTIGEMAFYWDASIRGLTLPDTVKVIERMAFHWCSNLRATIYTGGLEIGENAFGGSPGVTLIDGMPPAVTPEPTATPEPTTTPEPTAVPEPTATPTPDSSGSPVEDFGYSIENGAAIITEYRGSDANVVIPATMEGYPVTEIGFNAFNQVVCYTALETVSLPPTVHTIGRQAFWGCENLTAVYGAEQVTSYEDFAFGNCTKLASIAIGENVTRMAYGCFMGCPLPETVLCFPADSPIASAYDYGESLSMCFFEERNGEAILVNAHCGGGEVWHIRVPETYRGMPVTTIGENAFNQIACYTVLGTVSLPPTVHTIGRQAFWGCENLTAVYGAEQVTSYEDFAFGNCTKLASIAIGENVTRMAYGCFMDCPMLDIVLCLPADSPLTSAYEYGENVSMYFFEERNGEAVLVGGSCGAEGTWTVCVPGGYKGMPVTTIGKQAFSWDQNVGGLILPESIKVIEAEAFSNCPNLIATVYTAGVEIGSGAFYNCPGVTLLNEVPPEN